MGACEVWERYVAATPYGPDGMVFEIKHRMVCVLQGKKHRQRKRKLARERRAERKVWGRIMRKIVFAERVRDACRGRL